MDSVVYTQNAGDYSYSSSLPSTWQIDDLEYDCDCPGPPPTFEIPPPPRPPFMPEIECSDFSTQDFESCDIMTVIDAEYHGNPTIPTLTVVVGVCSLLLLCGVLIVFAFAWRNKRKVRSFLPCKSSAENRCDLNHGNGVIYEDINSMRSRGAAHPGSFEMLDIKSAHGNSYVIGRPPLFLCSSSVRQEHQYCPAPRPQDSGRRYCSQDLYNPVYEELSNGSGDRGESDGDSLCVAERLGSEDEFAEDELSVGDHYRGCCQQQHRHHHSGSSSLQGSTGNDLCRDVDSSDPDDRSKFLCHRPPCLRGRNGTNSSRHFSLPTGRRSRTSGGPHQRNHQQQQQSDQRRPKSLGRPHCCSDNRHHHGKARKPKRRGEGGEFHEGMLLDALCQLYPSIMRNNIDEIRIGGEHSHKQQDQHQHLPYILPVSEPSIVSPYETVSVTEVAGSTSLRHHPTSRHEHFAGFNKGNNGNKPLSQDSDSGYSNNTSGGHGSNSSRGGRSDTLRRVSSPSDYPI